MRGLTPPSPHAGGKVVLLKRVTLVLTVADEGGQNAVCVLQPHPPCVACCPSPAPAVAPNGADVQHALSELDERASLDGDVYLCERARVSVGFRGNQQQSQQASLAHQLGT